MFQQLLLQWLSWQTESSVPNYEKSMQICAEHASSDKQMGRDPINCIIMQLLCISHGYLHLLLTQCNMYQFSSHFCSYDIQKSMFSFTVLK
jgi:hypothetical protein